MSPVVIRRALLSVYDKTGIAEFAKALAEMGVEIISSGGTAEAIAAAGTVVREVDDLTGFPAMLGHRVVTLHPKVHGGILAVRDDPSHKEDMARHGIDPIDLVCVGLYPFSEVAAREGCDLAEAVEMIDIGGPAMVRAAAKNHRFVTVVTDTGQCERVIDEMRSNGSAVSEELRAALARDAFALTAEYDVAISQYLCQQSGDQLPGRASFSYRKLSDLRYGENPHQRAAFYVGPQTSEACVAGAKLLSGTEMSFVNYYDANGAFELVKEFDQPAVAIIKHANPAGCAIDEDLVEAYRKAYFGDVNACMGGIVAVNRPVTAELARAIVETYQRWGKERRAGGFLAHVVVAPGYQAGAVDIIKARKGWGPNVRLLETPPLTGKRSSEKAVKYVVGGLLVQQRDLVGADQSNWKVVTRQSPTAGQMKDLSFAWLVCKHVKSNAIVLAKDQALLGAGAGQMSRVTSSRLASEIARNYGGGGEIDPAGCVLASDAFLPFADSLQWAVDVGATAVIQPGGSKKDADVIAKADELGLAMVFTGTRHFNH